VLSDSQGFGAGSASGRRELAEGTESLRRKAPSRFIADTASKPASDTKGCWQESTWFLDNTRSKRHEDVSIACKRAWLPGHGGRDQSFHRSVRHVWGILNALTAIGIGRPGKHRQVAVRSAKL